MMVVCIRMVIERYEEFDSPPSAPKANFYKIPFLKKKPILIKRKKLELVHKFQKK